MDNPETGRQEMWNIAKFGDVPRVTQEQDMDRAEKRIYSIWRNMFSRCYYPKSEHFNYYGGRGIKVCDEWRNFRVFYKWAIENGYRDNLTIDRKNVNGDYEPENCQWADAYYQNNHTRKNHYVEYGGEIKTVAEWARDYGIHRCVLNNRIRRGWPIEEALTQPTRLMRRRKT